MTIVNIDSPEFREAVKRIIRTVLTEELNDYIQNASILPIKIQGSTLEGNEATGGDTLQYDAAERVVRFL